MQSLWTFLRSIFGHEKEDTGQLTQAGQLLRSRDRCLCWARPLSAPEVRVCGSYQTSATVDKKRHGSPLVNSPCNHSVLAFIPDFSLQGLVIQAFVGECIQMSTWRRWLGKLSAFKIFKEQLRLKYFWNHMIQNHDVSKAPRAWNCSITLIPPTLIIIRYLNSCIKT